MNLDIFDLRKYKSKEKKIIFFFQFFFVWTLKGFKTMWAMIISIASSRNTDQQCDIQYFCSCQKSESTTMFNHTLKKNKDKIV